MKTLVLGYGNELRRDDGIGPAVARAVEALCLPDVETLIAHQLTPELAADLAEADRAIFVDAAAAATQLCVEEVVPVAFTAASAHAGDPARLLGLAQAVYGTAPRAWMITVPAYDFDFGEELTPGGRRGVEDALAAIRGLLNDHA